MFRVFRVPRKMGVYRAIDSRSSNVLYQAEGRWYDAGRTVKVAETVATMSLFHCERLALKLEDANEYLLVEEVGDE